MGFQWTRAQRLDFHKVKKASTMLIVRAAINFIIVMKQQFICVYVRFKSQIRKTNNKTNAKTAQKINGLNETVPGGVENVVFSSSSLLQFMIVNGITQELLRKCNHKHLINFYKME